MARRPRRVRAAGCICLVVAGAFAASPESAQQKFDRIGGGKAAAHSRIGFTSQELVVWARARAEDYAPGATNNLHLTLGASEATGSATVDFLKLRRAVTGEEPGWLFRNLFSGRRDVSVTVRFQSANGRARVDVVRVEVSGIPIEGPALDFLIQSCVRPTFPDVKVGEWFALADRIDHFTVAPAGVTVVTGR